MVWKKKIKERFDRADGRRRINSIPACLCKLNVGQNSTARNFSFVSCYFSTMLFIRCALKIYQKVFGLVIWIDRFVG